MMRLALGFLCAWASVLAVAVPTEGPSLANSDWIGDGLSERTGADWYDEDPAPEFCAEFVLPEGQTEARIHFACAGFGWFDVRGARMASG